MQLSNGCSAHKSLLLIVADGSSTTYTIESIASIYVLEQKILFSFTIIIANRDDLSVVIKKPPLHTFLFTSQIWRKAVPYFRKRPAKHLARNGDWPQAKGPFLQRGDVVPPPVLNLTHLKMPAFLYSIATSFMRFDKRFFPMIFGIDATLKTGITPLEKKDNLTQLFSPPQI